MKVCIRGTAEQVVIGQIDEVCLDMDRILLATDGSEPAIAATQYAVTLAKTFGASIKAVFVDDGMEAIELPEEIESDEAWDNFHPSVKGLGIAKVMAERNDVPVEIEIIKGGVAKRIVRTAEEYNADMIVLGDTGRTGLARLGMGSIAETVVKASSTPVMVIKI